MTDNTSRNAEIIRRRLAGTGPRKIARDMGLSPNVVAGVLGRAGIGEKAGTPHGQPKLTEADVRAIRREYREGDWSAGWHQPEGVVGYGRLAQRYGVTPAAIVRIIKGRTWKHVA